MRSTSKVLAIVDPSSDTQRALERGVHFASKLNVPLEVFVVVYDQFVEHDEEACASLLQHQRERVEALVEAARHKVREISVEVRWGRPLSDEVIKRAEETNPLLVVKDTHHHSVLKRTLLSNSDWDLIRGCPSPLLLAKDRDLSSNPTFLAAIDPADRHDKPESLDGAILRVGKRLSSALGGSLSPVHVLDSSLAQAVEPMAAGAAMTAPVMPALTSHEFTLLKEKRQESFDQVLAAADIDAGTGSLQVGVPNDLLVEIAASREFDFVIMGAIARGFLDRILIGHTAEKVLDRLPCDLIIVKQIA